MSTEKKVLFTGADSGVSQTAKKIYSGILADAQKYTDKLKEQTGYINQQIKALEKKANLEIKQGKGVLAEQEMLLRHARTPDEKAKYTSRVESTRKGLEESSTVIETLKALLDETKKQTSFGEKSEKNSTKNLRESENQYQAMKSLARQEVREDSTGVRGKIKAAERAGYEGMDPRQAEKLMYQKTLLGSEKKEQSVFSGAFLGTLTAGIVQQVAASLGKITGATSGEEGFNTLLGGIPLVGGLFGGASSRAFEEQYGIQTQELGLSAKTGRRIKGNTGVSNLGYSTRESLGITGGLIEAAGSANGANQSGNAMLLQRGLGLSPQTISQIVKDIRTAGSSSDIVRVINEVIHSNPELRKDQTKLSEVLEQSSQLTNQLASQTENVDMLRNVGIVGALRSIGGSFANPGTAGARMMSINNALTSPGTDFQKARSFGVLSGNNPGMSYFQMLEAQEKGIGQKGYLTGVLKQLKRETGGGENFALAAMQNLGLSASSSRKLTEAFNKNPKMFDNFGGSKNDLDKILGSGGLTERAKQMTSEKDREKAEIDNQYALGAFAGTIDVAGKVFMKAAEKMGEVANKFDNATGLKKGSGAAILSGGNPVIEMWLNTMGARNNAVINE